MISMQQQHFHYSACAEWLRFLHQAYSLVIRKVGRCSHSVIFMFPLLPELHSFSLRITCPKIHSGSNVSGEHRQYMSSDFVCSFCLLSVLILC